MAKRLQINIPEPCHENWEAMTPVEKGRFCGACQKQVIDFSRMSDRQIAEFFRKPSNGSGCGRFLTSQLDREIVLSRKRIPWLKYFFTVALPAFLLSLKPGSSKAQGLVRVDHKLTAADKKSNCAAQNTPANPLTATTNPADSTSAFTVSGVVADEKGEAVPGALVRIKGTRTGVAADVNGKFRIVVKKGDVLVVSGTVLETTEQTISGPDMIIITVRKFEPGGIVLTVGGYFSTPYTKPIRRVTGFVKDEKGLPLQGAWVMSKNKKFISVTDEDGKFTASVSKKDLLVITNPGFDKQEVKVDKKDTLYVQMSKGNEQLTVNNEQDIPFVKLYPNPVKAGSSIVLEFNTTLAEGNYQWLLQGTAGQIVHQPGQRLRGNTKQVAINLPHVLPGNYFLVLLDPVSGKRYSQPLVIIQ